MDSDNLLFQLLEKMENFESLRSGEIKACENWMKEPFAVYDKENEFIEPSKYDSRKYRYWLRVEDIVSKLYDIHNFILDLFLLNHNPVFKNEPQPLAKRIQYYNNEIKRLVWYIRYEYPLNIGYAECVEPILFIPHKYIGKELFDPEYYEILGTVTRYFRTRPEPEKNLRIEAFLNACEENCLKINSGFYTALLIKLEKGVGHSDVIKKSLKRYWPLKGSYSYEEEEYYKLKEIFEERQNRLESKNPKEQIPQKLKTKKELLINSYNWLGRQIELNDFWNITNDLFHSDSTFQQFKEVFSNNPINDISPLKWHDNNASELLFFILELQEKGLLEKKKRQDYKQLTACILQSDGEPFNAPFSVLKQNLEINLSETKKDNIRAKLQKLT